MASKYHQSLYAAATEYIAAGYSVIPLNRDKSPASYHLPRVDGRASWAPFRERQATDDELQRWLLGKRAAAAIGIVGGYGGLLILDFDTAGGYVDWLASPGCRAIIDDLPPWPKVKTGRGDHAYLRCSNPPGNLALARDAAGKKIIETRGAGGYAVAPPSMHYEAGRPYEWRLNGIDSVPLLDDGEIAAILDSCRALDAYESPPEAPRMPVAENTAAEAGRTPVAAASGEPTADYWRERDARYLDAAWQGEIERVASACRAGEGGRNDAIFQAAANMKSIAAANGRYSDGDIMPALAAAAASYIADDGRRAFEKTVSSGIRKGAENEPRRLPSAERQETAENGNTFGSQPPEPPAAAGVASPPEPPPNWQPVKEPPAPSSPLKVKPASLAELAAAHYEPLTFLVDGMLAKGQLCLLGGRPKSGKSFLSMQMMKSIDTGESFLGKATRRGRVLCCDLEMGARRLNQRLKLIKWQPSAGARYILAGQMAALDNGQGAPGPGVSQLAELAADFDLIIIDTLISALSPAANENDNVMMATIVNALARVAHDTDTAIVIVHHTGKGLADDIFATVRGASAIRGAVDMSIVMERKTDEREAVLHIESRDFDAENMTIQMGEGGGWQYLGNARHIETVRAGAKVYRAMLDHPERLDGLTAAAIAAEIGTSERNVRKQLERLEESGHVEREGQASSQMGRRPDLWHVKA